MPRANPRHEPGTRPKKPISPAHKALGDVVSERLKRLDVTAAAVAAEAGIHETSFSFIRRGRQDITYSQLLAVAAELGLPASRLLAAAERLVASLNA